MANNAQPAAIASAIHDAIGVWVTDCPITPEKVLRALEKKAAGTHEPRREGKLVVFDDDISIGTIGKGHVKMEASRAPAVGRIHPARRWREPAPPAWAGSHPAREVPA